MIASAGYVDQRLCSLPRASIESFESSTPVATLDPQQLRQFVDEALDAIREDHGETSTPTYDYFRPPPVTTSPFTSSYYADYRAYGAPDLRYDQPSGTTTPSEEYSSYNSSAEDYCASSGAEYASPHTSPFASGSQKPTVARYDPSISYPTNATHEFVVYQQCLSKIDVSDRWVTRLTLASAPPSSALARVVWGSQPYSPAHYDEDCTLHTRYVFKDDNSGFWDVTFSPAGPSIVPRVPTYSTSSGITPLYTFIHFFPGSMTPSDTYPIGHRHWWRLQTCVGNGGARHRWTPSDGPGEWTARYDVEGENAETRRPARCVEHFAQCHLRTHDHMFPLSVLARAIRHTLK
ncbi:hypothetical protein RQP46_010997 [Phenoliferia psychrophenolica]